MYRHHHGRGPESGNGCGARAAGFGGPDWRLPPGKRADIIVVHQRSHDVSSNNMAVVRTIVQAIY